MSARSPRAGVDTKRVDDAVYNLSTVIHHLDQVIDVIERSSVLGSLAEALIADRKLLLDARLNVVCEVLYSADGCGFPTCQRCYPDMPRPRVRIEHDSAHTDDAPPHGIRRPMVMS